MAYIMVPGKCSFDREFTTWIIGFCIDTGEFFTTKQRFFYYEYPKCFDVEKDAIDFFYSHKQEFIGLYEKIKQWTFKKFYFTTSDGNTETIIY